MKLLYLSKEIDDLIFLFYDYKIKVYIWWFSIPLSVL